MADFKSPLLQKFGVFEASGVDAGVAAHYGEPLKEQRRFILGAEKFVVADYSHLDVVTVSGPDRHSWMTTLSSQIMDGMKSGDSRELTLLSAQGRVEFVPFAVEDGDKLWLIAESGQGEDLAAFLNSMKFMLRVDIENVSAEYGILVSFDDPRTSEKAPKALQKALIFSDPWPGVVAGGTSYTEIDPGEHPGRGLRRFFSIIPLADLLDIAPEVSLSGIWAAEALRIEAWRPRYGNEVDEKTIPHELDLMRTAVHLKKGCYKGQETVARVHNLGHPPRRLVFLDLDGSEHTLPEVGASVYADTKKVGKVTSVAQHWEAGPIALAVIKRNVDPAAVLSVVDEPRENDSSTPSVQYAATQTVIVSPDAGQVAGRRDMGNFFRG